MGTLIGFDANASRSRGMRRLDARGSRPAACYALRDYDRGGDRETARVLTRAEFACRADVIDATDVAAVRRLMTQPDPTGSDAA